MTDVTSCSCAAVTRKSTAACTWDDWRTCLSLTVQELDEDEADDGHDEVSGLPRSKAPQRQRLLTTAPAPCNASTSEAMPPAAVAGASAPTDDTAPGPHVAPDTAHPGALPPRTEALKGLCDPVSSTAAPHQGQSARVSGSCPEAAVPAGPPGRKSGKRSGAGAGGPGALQSSAGKMGGGSVMDAQPGEASAAAHASRKSGAGAGMQGRQGRVSGTGAGVQGIQGRGSGAAAAGAAGRASGAATAGAQNAAGRASGMAMAGAGAPSPAAGRVSGVGSAGRPSGAAAAAGPNPPQCASKGTALGRVQALMAGLGRSTSPSKAAAGTDNASPPTAAGVPEAPSRPSASRDTAAAAGGTATAAAAGIISVPQAAHLPSHVQAARPSGGGRKSLQARVPGGIEPAPAMPGQRRTGPDAAPPDPPMQAGRTGAGMAAATVGPVVSVYGGRSGAAHVRSSGPERKSGPSSKLALGVGVSEEPAATAGKRAGDIAANRGLEGRAGGTHGKVGAWVVV
jgi:hypothetical protein